MKCKLTNEPIRNQNLIVKIKNLITKLKYQKNL
jgi:hypothetical protein